MNGSTSTAPRSPARSPSVERPPQLILPTPLPSLAASSQRRPPFARRPRARFRRRGTKSVALQALHNASRLSGQKRPPSPKRVDIAVAWLRTELTAGPLAAILALFLSREN